MSVEFSPDSTYLVSGDGGCNVKIWNVAAKQLHCEFKHSQHVWGLAFSPNGNLVAAVAAGDGENFKIWDIASQTQVSSWTAHSSHVTGISWSSCGKYIVSGGCDKKIRVWNSATMTECHSFDEPTWEFTIYSSDFYCPVQFIPNTTSFVSGGHDGSIKVWDIETGACTAHFTGHNKHVWSIDVSPCGRFIVAGDSCTNDVELYDINGHRYTYQGHTEAENCAAFSPCGKFIISGGWGDRMILTWANWKMLSDAKLLEDGGEWAAKQYAQVAHDDATFENETARILQHLNSGSNLEDSANSGKPCQCRAF